MPLKQLLFFIILQLLWINVKSQKNETSLTFETEEQEYPWFKSNLYNFSSIYRQDSIFNKFSVPDSSQSFIEFEIFKISKSEYLLYQFDSSLQVISKGKLKIDSTKTHTMTIENVNEYGDILYEEYPEFTLVRTGLWYFIDKNEKQTGNYVNGKKHGIWESYISFEKIDARKQLIIEYYESNVIQVDTLNLIKKELPPGSIKSIIIGEWEYSSHFYHYGSRKSPFIVLKRTKAQDRFSLTFGSSTIISGTGQIPKTFPFFLHGNKQKVNWKFNDDSILEVYSNDENFYFEILYMTEDELIMKQTNANNRYN